MKTEARLLRTIEKLRQMGAKQVYVELDGAKASVSFEAREVTLLPLQSPMTDHEEEETKEYERLRHLQSA